MASYVPFLFALLALLAQANAHNEPGVYEFSYSSGYCDKSLFKDLCNTLFAPLREAMTGDVVGLTGIALTTATRQAIATHAHIQFLNKNCVDKTIKARLSDCATNYQSAIESLKESAESFQRKNYADVNVLVTAAMSEATSCEDGIKEVKKSLPRLSPLNTKFNGLCSILLTFSNLCVAPKLG